MTTKLLALLAELDRLEEKATPGPIETFGPYDKGGWLDGGHILSAHGPGTPPDEPEVGFYGGEPLWFPTVGMSAEDAEAFAALRNHWPMISRALRAAIRTSEAARQLHSSFLVHDPGGDAAWCGICDGENHHEKECRLYELGTAIEAELREARDV